MLSQDVPKTPVVYEDQVKAISYGPMVQIGDLELFLWLDAELALVAAIQTANEKDNGGQPGTTRHCPPGWGRPGWLYPSGCQAASN